MTGRSRRLAPAWWLLFAATASLTACSRKSSGTAAASGPADTVFVVPGSHLDIGYTAPPSAIQALRISSLDAAIDAAEHDPRFEWFEEGGWAVEAWLDHYHDQPDQIARLKKLVMSGRIGVGATLLSAHAAAFPGALQLLTMHLDRIQRELGRRPTVAVVNDVPAVPEALVDALAAAGIHYLLAGPNLTLSPALPAALVGHPFYWESASGSRVLVDIEPDGYTAGMADWGLPPECARVVNPGRFPSGANADQVLQLGVATELAHRVDTLPLTLVQDETDNGDPSCAVRLPDAVAEWNASGHATAIAIATPDVYFAHLLTRFGTRLPVRRGEWGGDWDVLRATEPVWSWRLRQAMEAIGPNTSYPQLMSLATVIDHNIGLGPRWAPYLSPQDAAHHVADVAALYRQAVSGVLGPQAVSMLPPPPALPAAGTWPPSWQAVIGAAAGAARVRVGPGFPHRDVEDSMVTLDVPVTVRADAGTLVVRTRLVRSQLAQRFGPTFRAVVELRLAAPFGALQLAPLDSPDAVAGRWLLGAAPVTVIAPGGVRVADTAWSIDVSGPVAMAWSLVPGGHESGESWLQVLAFEEADEGPAQGGVIRAPFAALYPGEPDTLDFAFRVTLRTAPQRHRP